MEEVLVKSHLIITDIHDEYHMHWSGKILDTNPLFKNGKPVFIIIGGRGRTELNTTDMLLLERTAKILTEPKGKSAISTDKSRIYIKEVDGSETLLGTMTHNRVKSYAPMYDKVGYR